jgi:Short-chain alcohol dehydrogenase of unknown specificity
MWSVTGAGRGIGKAIALRLASEGARLSLFGRGVDALHATADDVGGAFVTQLDIRDASQVERAFADAAEANGRCTRSLRTAASAAQRAGP